MFSDYLDKIKRREIFLLLLTSLLCSAQSTMALTWSLAGIYPEVGMKPIIILYLLGAFFLLLSLISMNLLTGSRLIVPLIFLVFWNFIAIVNYYEVLFHGMVLTHQDINNISTAAAQIGKYSFKITKDIEKILISFLTVVLILLYIYFKKEKLKIKRKYGFVPAGLLIASSYILVYSPFAIVKSGGWSWELKYYADGFVVGTMENIAYTIKPFNKPDEYNIDEITNIVGTQATTDDYPDIIMILNETYYDMDYLVNFDTDISYNTNYDSMEAYKGYAAVPMTGGGTNASEYELLTGNAVTLLTTSTPFNDLDLSEYGTVVEYLKKLGYSTMAAHSEPPQNYHRAKAWNQMGFSFTYFKKDFHNLHSYGNRYFASDSSVFDNFKRFYEEMPDDGPRFAFLLTIQNHGDWNSNDSKFDLVHIRKTNNLSEYDCERVNEFLTCIKFTDDFICELTDYYESCGRKVVVCMVGDHGPSIMSKIPNDESNDNGFKKRQVPYFIWSNFEIDYSILPENHDIDVCSLTPCTLKAAGLPLSAYYSQLVEVADIAKCISGIDISDKGASSIGYLLKDGRTDSVFAGTREAEEVKKYFYMEYNNLSSKDRIRELFE